MIKHYVISIKLVQMNMLHDEGDNTISDSIDPRLEKMLLDKCRNLPDGDYNEMQENISNDLMYLISDNLNVDYKNQHLIISFDSKEASTALHVQMLNTSDALSYVIHQCNYDTGENNFHFVQMTNDVEIKIN